MFVVVVPRTGACSLFVEFILLASEATSARALWRVCV